MADIVKNLSVLPSAATPNMQIYGNKFESNKATFYKNKQTYQQIGLAMAKDKLAVVPEYAEDVVNTWDTTIGKLATPIEMGDFIGIDGAIDDAAFEYATNGNLLTAKYNSSIKQQGDATVMQNIASGATKAELGGYLMSQQNVPKKGADGVIPKMGQYDIGVKYYDPNAKITALMSRIGRDITAATNKTVDIDATAFKVLGDKEEPADDYIQLSDLMPGVEQYYDPKTNTNFVKYINRDRGNLVGGFATMSTIGSAREAIITELLSHDQDVMGFYHALAARRNIAGKRTGNGKEWTGTLALLEDINGIRELSDNTEWHDNRSESITQTGNGTTNKNKPYTRAMMIDVTTTPIGVGKATYRSMVLAVGDLAGMTYETEVKLNNADINVIRLEDKIAELDKNSATYKEDYIKLDQELSSALILQDDLGNQVRTRQAALRLHQRHTSDMIHHDMDARGIKYNGNNVFSAKAEDNMNAILDRYSVFYKDENDNIIIERNQPEWLRRWGLQPVTTDNTRKMMGTINHDVQQRIHDDIVEIMNVAMPTNNDQLISALNKKLGTNEQDLLKVLELYAHDVLTDMGHTEENMDEDASPIAFNTYSAYEAVIKEFGKNTESALSQQVVVTNPIIVGDKAVDITTAILEEGILQVGGVSGHTYLGDDIILNTAEGNELRELLSTEGAKIYLSADSLDGKIGANIVAPDTSIGNKGKTISKFMYLTQDLTNTLIDKMLNGETPIDPKVRAHLKFITMKDDNGIYLSEYAKAFQSADINSSNMKDVTGVDIELTNYYDLDISDPNNVKYVNESKYAEKARKSKPPRESIPYNNKYMNWVKVGDDKALLQIVSKSSDNDKLLAFYVIFNEQGQPELVHKRPSSSDIKNGISYTNDISSTLAFGANIIDMMNAKKIATPTR